MSVAPPPKPGDIVRLTIQSLGGLGDGVARLGDIPVYVSLAAPGDTADVLIGARRGDGLAGRLMGPVTPGSSRQTAPCVYFGECGGCSLQHIVPETYVAWKGSLVGLELARHGLGAVPIAPMQAPEAGDPAALRRRVALAAHRLDGRTLVGFHARATRRVVPIERCLLLTPGLNGLIDPLRRLMTALLGEGERGQAAMTDLGDALDVLLASPRPPSAAGRAAMVAFAAERRLARVSWQAYRNRHAATGEDDEAAGEAGAETIVQHGPCRVMLAGRAVDFPPGGFLQPCQWGEATLQRLVVAGVGGAKRIADLFAGLGTFSFALAEVKRRTILAVEGDAALARALGESANRAGWSGKVTVQSRNLDRRPLLAGELADMDAVVLNPPRTGAKAQCERLAGPPAEGPSRLVMVSCNPATLARDARILADGGWRAESVTPVDQFLYSAHIEAVAVFTRAAKRLRQGAGKSGGWPGQRS